MVRRLVACWFVTAFALILCGCPVKKEEPYKMPTLPRGYESKPGFGGMGGDSAAQERAIEASGAPASVEALPATTTPSEAAPSETAPSADTPASDKSAP